MSRSLLWINKDLSSKRLSRSSDVEDKDIRRHVQVGRSCPRLRRHDVSRRDRFDANTLRCAQTEVTDEIPFNSFQLCRSLPLSNIGLASEEQRSLSFFILHTAGEWSGWEDASFWSGEVLRASHHSRAITHGLVALAAIHEGSRFGHRRVQLESFARHQLSKSIQQLKTSQLTHIEGLISCIVLICLENAQSRRQSYQLLRSGEAMLCELENDINLGRTFISASERQLVHDYIRPLFDRLRARLCTIGDPVATLALCMKTHQAWILSNNSVPTIPSTFTTLEEARNCLRALLDWCCSDVQRAGSADTTTSRTLHSFRELCASWENALLHMTSASSVHSASFQRSAKLMRIGCLFGRILLESLGTTNECVYDGYQVEFGTIVRLADETTRQHDISFGIDSGLLDILAFTGSRCRDPLIRRSALAYLARGQRVEGDRGSTIAARILERIIELEERGLEVLSCSDIPESSRWRVSEGAQYHRHGLLRLDLVQAYNREIKSRIWISIPSSDTPDLNLRDLENEYPDVVFGEGSAAFLNDGVRGTYAHLHSTSFYFPIPRV